MSETRLPVLDSEPPAQASADPRRRDFMLLTVGWVATLGSLFAASAAALRGLLPNLLDEPNQRYRAGKPEEYTDSSVTFLDEIRVFVVRRGNTFQAMSAVCTHLGCTVNRDASGQGYRCPCHGSVFDQDGRVVSGPAPKPLPCYAMVLARDGRLVIDRDRSVSPDHFLVLDARRGPVEVRS